MWEETQQRMSRESESRRIMGKVRFPHFPSPLSSHSEARQDETPDIVRVS
jgi:hypothetical protein